MCNVSIHNWFTTFIHKSVKYLPPSYSWHLNQITIKETRMKSIRNGGRVQDFKLKLGRGSSAVYSGVWNRCLIAFAAVVAGIRYKLKLHFVEFESSIFVKICKRNS